MVGGPAGHVGHYGPPWADTPSARGPLTAVAATAGRGAHCSCGREGTAGGEFPQCGQ